MAISWKVTKVDTVPMLEGKSDVVTTSDVYCYWDNGSGDGRMYYPVKKRVGLNCDNVGTDPNFTPYADITAEQAVDWSKAALGPDMTAYMEAEVLAAKNNAENPPPPGPPPVPWE